MKSVSAKQLAELVGGKLLGDETKTVSGVSSLKDATADQVSFVGNKKYQSQLETTKAQVVLVCEELENEPLNGRTFIVCECVDLAFSKVIMVLRRRPRYIQPEFIRPPSFPVPPSSAGMSTSAPAPSFVTRSSSATTPLSAPVLMLDTSRRSEPAALSARMLLSCTAALSATASSCTPA